MPVPSGTNVPRSKRLLSPVRAYSRRSEKALTALGCASKSCRLDIGALESR